MNYIKRFFLSRTTIICLIISALAAITLSAFIPQSFLTASEKMLAWQTVHPFLGRLSELLGLHHIYTHPAFALVLAGVVISLVISSWNQCLTAWQRTFHPDRGISCGESFAVPGTVDETCLTLTAGGYYRQGASVGIAHFVRHPWGHWGNTLLHLGMVVVIAASLFIALTQQRGVIHLVEGAIQHPSDPLLLEEHGLFAKPLLLPEALRLDRVTYSFWPTYGVRQVASKLSFLPEVGTTETKTVEINSFLTHRGIHFYQGIEFGHAFFVEVTGPSGLNQLFQLQIQHPETPDKPGYNDYKDLLGDGIMVRAKYLVDAEQKSFDNVNPLLTLLLDRQGKEVGRLSMQTGAEGAIGPYRFRLRAFSPWSRLIVVKLSGMSGIFFGFFIICLGGVLHFFTPPREVSVQETTFGGTIVCWRATKFAGFYLDEIFSLKKTLGCEESHG
ncbi:MAG: ResB-like family cytochrome C biogenesis protein [Desulfuromonadales bacterium GWD2_54_10]|nr:MAG: ResB-like family cytochrome C biogenesis protein [Desulfuromonadales bacterium GWD2_54_10]